MNERQNRLLDLLSPDEKRSVRELSSLLKVSEVTIRQDLNFLEGKGMLRRVHGAAVLNDADDLAVRMGMNYQAKLSIARKAATFINDGETVLIESGSVNALLATELGKSGKVVILTTNIFIARQFRDIPRARIILLGGIYQHESESMVGMLTKAGIDMLNFSKAFLGIDGYEESAGFTSRDMLRAEISSYIIKKSPETFILTDSTKFGKKELALIAKPEEITHLITDNDLDQKYLKILQDKGLDVVLVG